MNAYDEEEKVQTRRRKADTAIQLAMANRWQEAAEVNKSILQLFPNDGDSHNRLGRALMELGKYAEAKKAYKRALALDPTNQIARKNMERLTVLAKSKAAQASTSQVDPKLFIEEMGKTAVTTLHDTLPETLTKLNAGERVVLKPKRQSLIVETPGGEYVGVVEPKLRSRLLKLIDGGNRYEAAVTSLSAGECRIIIKEVYQHPSQAGRPSFPATVATEGTRPYTKGSLLRYGAPRTAEIERAEDGDEDTDDGRNDWDTEQVVQEGHVRLNDAAEAEEADYDDMDE